MRYTKVAKLVWNLFALFGLACFLVGLAGFYYFGPSKLKMVAAKAAEKAGIGHVAQKMVAVLPGKYSNYQFQGRIRQGHPRILLAGQPGIDLLRQRYRRDEAYRNGVDSTARTEGLLWKASAWAAGGDTDTGKFVVSKLPTIEAIPPYDGGFGNMHDIAMAYDLVWNHPAWAQEGRQLVNVRLKEGLAKTLVLLDGNSPSLWHGRFQLACIGWILAASLDDADAPGTKKLVASAQAHFLDALHAAEITEGWPEGYNYWINNRAFLFMVAAAAHIHAVDAPELNSRIRKVAERVGLWTIYGTEPTARFCLYGDGGPRNDLKEETRRVIDLAEKITGNDAFRIYSKYLLGRYGSDGYYWDYRWGLPLFGGATVAEAGLKDLTVLNAALNRSELFGRNGLGQAFIRSDWGPDATFISFMAGAAFTHHGHYQAGAFTITKKAPLAITSGTYGEYTSPHRLNYYIRAVAANSILVLKPGEKVKPNQFFPENVADGGQRIIIPTGSAIQSVEDWRSNLNKGRHYEGGKTLAFDNTHDDFTYISSDLTGAYNNTEYDETGDGGKVSSVTRSLVYLYGEDVLIDYDRVVATDGAYTKKWLLHSWAKPRSRTEKVLVGDEYNGILETKDDAVDFEYNGGTLQVQRLLPEDGVIRKVGGPDYRYYVETDGDDRDLDGKNMAEGSNDKPWFDAGLWRIEIQPERGRKTDEFLVLMKPGLKGQESVLGYREVKSPSVAGVLVGETAVLFPRGNGPLPGKTLEYTLGSNSKIRHLLFNLPKARAVQVRISNEDKTLQTNDEGVLMFESAPMEDGKVQIFF